MSFEIKKRTECNHMCPVCCVNKLDKQKVRDTLKKYLTTTPSGAYVEMAEYQEIMEELGLE